MERISKAALIYHAGLSDGAKKSVEKFFNGTDMDRDGKISSQEYIKYLEKKGHKIYAKPKIFKALDMDENGSLDFDEVIALFYLCQTGRAVLCDGCKSLLQGSYFGCFQCYSGSKDAYNLCLDCYRGKKFEHHQDAVFLDNSVLLDQCRSVVQDAPDQSKENIIAGIRLMVSAAVLASQCSIM